MNLDTTQMWLVCVSVSSSIAAVVGFAVQLRTVNNLRLENKKLQLEIEQLEKSKQEAERRIVIPSTEQVEKYNDIMFSRLRVRTNDAAIPRRLVWRLRLQALKAALKEYAVYFVFFAVLFYLLFDIYRVALWAWSIL